MKTATIGAKRDAAYAAYHEALVLIERLEKYHKATNSYYAHCALLEMKHDCDLQNKAWRRYSKQLREKAARRAADTERKET